jgi:hypothetical protein
MTICPTTAWLTKQMAEEKGQREKGSWGGRNFTGTDSCRAGTTTPKDNTRGAGLGISEYGVTMEAETQVTHLKVKEC